MGFFLFLGLIFLGGLFLTSQEFHFIVAFVILASILALESIPDDPVFNEPDGWTVAKKSRMKR